MELDRYRELYLRESREHLSRLRALLEASPQGPSPESVNDLFRHAHSLKGMAASMSFSETSSLAHRLETLFDRWRKGSAPAPQEVEAALSASDALEGLLDAVEETGGEEGASAAARRAAEGLLAPAGGAPEPPPPAPPASEAPAPAEEAPPAAATLTVTVDAASALPAARFLVVAQKVREAFPGARMEPDLVTLQKTQGRKAAFFLPENRGLKELARLLLALPEVASVTVEETSPRPPAGERALIRDLKVSARDLDDLLDRAAELLHSLNQLEAALDGEERRRHRFWLESHRAHLGRLSDRVLAVRLVPFDALVERLQRTVREVGGRLGKRAVLKVSGAEEKIDRGLLERLQDPLLHLVRNALDHGLEPEEERRRAGKAPEGLLRLEIRRAAEALLVTLSDDGRGIDPEAVRRTAVERRLCTPQEAALLTEDRLYDLLTLPAFSTRREVSEVSGRGVGLDVVRTAAEALGGHLEIRSTSGRGSAFTLVVPSASALTRILVFSYGEAGPRFGIPVSQVSRIYPLSAFPVTGGPRPFLADGDTLIPVLPWRRGKVGREGYGLRLAFEGQDHALLVGSVFQMERVVIQPLGPPLDMVPEWMGAALLSTGEVAYVLDGRAVVRRGEGESHAV
ncbi:MAG: chemotaxis protein CheA [Acidobacteriota bacterium]